MQQTESCKTVEPRVRIRLDGPNWKGYIHQTLADGTLVLKLDNGMEVRAQKECITILEEESTCNTGNTSNSPQKEIRDEKGRFTPGHPKLGGRVKGATKSVRQTRKELLSQLQPYISDVGTIISLIDDPAEQILAITRLMKFCVPTYSAVEYSESAPRSLSAEQKLAQLNARYNGLPDPTIRDDEEEE